MKPKNKKIYSLSLLIISLICTLISLGGVIFATASAIVVTDIVKTPYFEYTFEGHKFKCYNATTDVAEDDGYFSAAIEWLDEEGNNFPTETLNIPETVTNSSTNQNYKVRAICDGGFRYCNSKTINVPNTVVHIGKEAFAYCEKITEFVFPYGVTKIEPSTFLDCHKLETVVYRNSTNGRTLTNSTITEIGDHAFDSCISLKNFYCPSSVVNFKKSCFQKCSSIATFYFPAEKDDHSNQITIEPYAFADCSELALIYFEENMHTIRHHAFSGANSDCEIDYTGSTEPSYDAHWRDLFIATDKSEVIPINVKQQIIRQDDEYPGLYYTVGSGDIKLDWGNDDTPIKYSQSGNYACIYNFVPPFETKVGYWNHITGRLDLPDALNGLPIKVIKPNTFATNNYVKELYLNESLVQIAHNAFFKCTEMKVLNFSRCTSLKEIGYGLFFDKSEQNKSYNDKIRSLVIPNTVEYIGDFAFFNLTNLVDCIQFGDGTGLDCELKVIGDRAFSISQHFWQSIRHNNVQLQKINPGTIDLVLPCSLSDQAEEYAKLKRFHYDYNWNTKTYARHYAIGGYAFGCAYTLKSAKIASCNHAEHDNDDEHDTIFTTSLAQNVFNRCQNIVFFRSNTNLCYIGPDTFKGDDSLKEVFLDSTKAEAHSTHDYPWGLEDFSENYNNTLFSASSANSSRPDLVVYVSGSKAPKKLDDNPQTGAKKFPWNVESNGEYKSDLTFNVGGYDSGTFQKQIRRTVPTFYNVHFTNEDDILYWKPSDRTFATTRPSTLAEYNAGLVSIVKTSGGKYTIAKYYASSGNGTDEIDLTGLTYKGNNISSNITTIGSSCFAADGSSSNKNFGKYFVLPSSVKKIEERAFMRLGTTNTDNGVRIVTYKDGDTIKVPNGSSSTYALLKKACVDSSSTFGYCVLPANLERLERNAFYNHKFSSVNINTGITFIGNGAFFVSTSEGSKLCTFTLTGNSTFSIGTDNGLYYSLTGKNKTLLYMPPASTNDLTLTLNAGTVAIGYAACANINYKEIVLPTGLKTIYGSGFANNNRLTTVSGAGLSTLEYISGKVRPDDSEVYDFNDTDYTSHFDIIDFRKFPHADNYEYYESNHSAFANCANLTSIDFTAMTKLKKIGRGAFRNCGKLKNCANSASYSFCGVTHTGGNNAGGTTTLDTATTINEGVLDLSKCKKLEVISYQAFVGCSSINYIILPNTTDDYVSESHLYVGRDPDFKYFDENENNNTGIYRGHFSDTNITLLFGESYKQADSSLKQLNSHKHYQGDLLQIQTRYYRADSISDLDESSDVKRYWTIDEDTGKYVLFTHWYEAHDYFVAIEAAQQNNE